MIITSHRKMQYKSNHDIFTVYFHCFLRFTAIVTCKPVTSRKYLNHLLPSEYQMELFRVAKHTHIFLGSSEELIFVRKIICLGSIRVKSYKFRNLWTKIFVIFLLTIMRNETSWGYGKLLLLTVINEKILWEKSWIS